MPVVPWSIARITPGLPMSRRTRSVSIRSTSSSAGGEPPVGQRAADGEAPHPGGFRGGDARLGVLERHRLGRVDAEPLEREQVARRVGLPVLDVVRGHDRRQFGRDPRRLDDGLDLGPERARDDRDGNARGRVAHRLAYRLGHRDPSAASAAYVSTRSATSDSSSGPSTPSQPPTIASSDSPASRLKYCSSLSGLPWRAKRRW